MREVAIAQNGCVHKFRFIPANTGEQNGCSSGSSKQIERKILHVYMDLFFFSSPALFKIPHGDRIYSLCTVRRSRKGIPKAVNSIRPRIRGCGLIM